MALDLDKKLQNAERLLKQGKVASALGILRQVAAGASKDLAIQNRIGDILARGGRHSEAFRFYERIADQFTQAGFHPKAVAILKKMLRIQPDEVSALVRLGELYLRQNLPGEARNYLLHAADKALEAGTLDAAREIYARLAEAEPADPRHRARLAETLAAAGDTEVAGRELLALAASLEDNPKQAENREQICRRASELLPLSREPVLGVAACLVGRGDTDAAIAFIESKAEELGSDALLTCELAALYDTVGRSEDASRALRDCQSDELPLGPIERVLRARIERGEGDRGWDEGVVPLLDHWSGGPHTEAVTTLLEGLANLNEPGYVPALERLLDAHERAGNAPAAAAVLERVIPLYRSAAMDERATAALARLGELDPESQVLRSEQLPEKKRAGTESVDPPAEAPAPVDEEIQLAEPAASDDAPGEPLERSPDEAVADPGELPIEIVAPAVPLNKSDEEFVSGRLTQAEILQKYGLEDKAVEQIREVVDRFPGHAEAQERMVRFARGKGDKAAVASTLMSLSLAHNAGGNSDRAREAALEADRTGKLAPADRDVLLSLGLLQPGAKGPSATPEVARRSEVPEPPGEPQAEPDSDDVVIDFDAMEEPPTEPPVEPAVESPFEPAVEPPVEPAVEPPVDPAAEFRPEPAGAEDDLSDLLAAAEGDAEDADDDLSALTAALESDLFVDDNEPLVPESSSEQSLEEVFAAFKEQVEEEVEKDDHRTHYDLGIAYKEMGLIDEAIGEFDRASQSEDLHRDACTMLALCLRDKGDHQEAVAWYRRALDTSDGDMEANAGLHYDLAETLEECGDREAALDVFRTLLDSDPSFRDVQSRISELESRTRS